MNNIGARPSVAVVILNWNNPGDTLACLQSIAALDYPLLKTIVVDNGSSDNSVERIRSAYPDVQVVETGANLGYAGGNNVGIHHALAAGAEAVCILNNDVTVEPDFLGTLMAALQREAGVGVVTPLVAQQTNGVSSVWALGAAVDWHTALVTRCHAGESADSRRSAPPFAVAIAPGAAMLVKREVFERVGLLDESYFLYFEETDWCLKVHQAGYRILAVPGSLVWHKVSATLGTTSPVIDYYMLRNHLHLIQRHWSGVRRPYLLLRTALRNLATIAAYTVKTHQGKRIPHRNARVLALRDAALGRWGRMGPDVAQVCCPELATQ